MRRLTALGVALAFLLASPALPTNRRGRGSAALAAGAPLEGDRFMNPDPTDRGGLSVAVPFFLGRLWVTMFPRGGAARLVPFDPEAIRRNPSITWIGHSTMLVRMDHVTFLTDPVFSDRVGPTSFLGLKRLVAPGVPMEALPPIDFVTVSHDHYDHTDLPSIRRLAAAGVPFVVPLRLGQLIRDAGGEAIELDWWQSTTIGAVRITCVPAQHFSGRSLTDGNQRLWAGFVVQGPTRRFYHAGDTAYFPGFTEIGKKLGPIDLAAIPIAAYEPAAMMRPVHINPEDAAQAAVDLGAKRVVGMHFGTFDSTDEPLDEPPKRFRTAAKKLGLGATRAWVLDVGETRDW